jgi:hypothetical protein
MPTLDTLCCQPWTHVASTWHDVPANIHAAVLRWSALLG